MDLITFILSCSFVSIDDGLVRSVAMIESRETPTYVRAYGRHDGIDYRDPERALEAIARLTESADGAYVGLMGVPTTIAAAYEVSAEQLLQPCDNIRVASAMLASFRADCSAQSVADLVDCTLEKYGTATGFTGDLFADQVIFGALAAPPSEDDSLMAEKISDRLVFEQSNDNPPEDSLFFDLDLSDAFDNSDTKIAEELPEED